MRRYGFILLAASLAACAPALHTSVRQAVVYEQLFFGRNREGREIVSDSAWTVFLRDEVTPRFPEGLTVLQSRGQWRDSTGHIEREAGYVLTLLHPASRAAD